MLGINQIMVGLVLIVKAIQINCHGRLLNPVARTSAWRLFPNIFPAYYDDNQMFCGGVQTLWEQNGTHHLIKRVLIKTFDYFEYV